MLVLACNPCPCGEYSTASRDHRCQCSEVKRREYRRKISGPIADRIDITRVVEANEHERSDPMNHDPEPSAEVLARVVAARERQRARYAGADFTLNAHATGWALRNEWPLDPVATTRLDGEVHRGRLTRRGATRVHRVAWSVADLRGRDVPGPAELAGALRLRRGEPLEHATTIRAVPRARMRA